MNCGRSSSVEWKLPKLQRRVRFPSPAPAPPGHAPGGFVMPTSHPPSTECGGTIGATLSPRELGPAVPVQNSPHTSHTVPVPVQNSPSKPKISQFGAFCSCWESFIPFLSPTSRAWRVFSRTNTSTTTGTKETTPPHNTQSHAMKDYPPTLHTQHDAMKHLPPQHATNNKNSPIFTMQGRTFFHNTHHTPTPGRHFFQPTPLPAKETQTRPSSFSIASSLPGQTARTSRMAARSQHDEAVH